MLYPLVELTTALLWAGAIFVEGPSVGALKLAVAATLLLGIAVSDARKFIIPHEFSIGGTAIALAFGMQAHLPGIGGALKGALFGAGFVLLIGECSQLLLGQEAMGGGDCALMGMVGAFFGWEAVLPVVSLGAFVSLILTALAALRGKSQNEVAAGQADGETVGIRWTKMLQLLAGAAGLLAALYIAFQTGILGNTLSILFYGVVGAGAAYYLSFLLPVLGFGGSWLGVVGLLGASVGVAVGGRGIWQVTVLAVVIAGLSLVSVGRIKIAAVPDTVEDLSAGGYLPFGVGLAIAAGLLAYLGGYAWVHQLFANLRFAVAA